jgi:hypothetical protein
MSLKASQRFAQLSASEKIQGFDQTEAGREAQDKLAILPCQTSKGGSNGSEVCDAVQSGEVRKCTIKFHLWIKLTDAFCGQLTEEYGKTMGVVFKTLLGLSYHLPRSIASQDGDAVAGEEDGVLPGATVKFKNPVVFLAGSGEYPPYRIALRSADERIGEPLIVILRDAVEGCAGG